MVSDKTPAPKHVFTGYQKFMIAVLSFLQFTIILDFMVLSPLGAQLMEDMHVMPAQFGLVVSAYAFSAGAAGIIAAGFADKFDRKKLLLFFYVGFLFGTMLCALAPDYTSLLIARIVAGLFGGVIGAVGMAIVSDIFPMEVRGRVMGFTQMSFAASQVLGIPIGLVLANHFGWHAPFWLILGVGLIVGFVILWKMQPVVAHLAIKSDRNAFQHFWNTLTRPEYLRAFLATILLATGGFMMMPFGSAYSTHNLGVSLSNLPILFGVTGIFSIIFGPLLGKASDRFGKLNLFLAGSALSIVMIAIYTHLGVTPLWLLITCSVIMWVGISSRMISASTLFTGIPSPQDRGAFMSVSSAVQQISGGLAAALAGVIVVKSDSGMLQHYDILGYVVILSMVIAAVLMYRLNTQVERKKAAVAALIEPIAVVENVN